MKRSRRLRNWSLAVTLVLTVIGIPGTVDDLVTWRRWLSDMPASTLQTVVLLLAAVGWCVVIVSWSVELGVRRRILGKDAADMARALSDLAGAHSPMKDLNRIIGKAWKDAPDKDRLP